ncbi:MAG: 2-dehydro-3-deoxy-6-phosphogalactonate aldolase, partial [Mesorhizobium sp.]
SEKDFAGYKAAGVSVFGLGSSLFKPGMSVDEVATRAQAAVAAWDAAFGAAP